MHDVVRNLGDILVFHKLQEDVFERRLADLATDIFRGAIGGDLAPAKNEELRTNFFNDFENVRAVENGFSTGTEQLNEILDDEHGGYVEARKGFVQYEDVGIVHQRKRGSHHGLSCGPHDS